MTDLEAPDAPDSAPDTHPEPAPAPSVARSLRELDGLGERDIAEHPDVYQRIHAELQSALAAIDDA